MHLPPLWQGKLLQHDVARLIEKKSAYDIMEVTVF
jgi:hypothetical protein